MAANWQSLAAALLPRLLLIAAAALLARLTLGSAWAWAAVAIGLTAIVVVQTRQLIVLGNWLRAPDSADFPDAGGIWGEVFIRLSRKLRDDAKALQRVEADLEAFREAIGALPEGVVLLDSSEQIMWANRAAERHLGISLPRDAGAIVTQLLRTPGFAEYLQRPDAGQPFVITGNGERARSYALAIVPFGERRRILVSTDITDARRVEAMRSDFVANVSHEMRTPLTVVSGFLEHLSDADDMDPGQRRHFVRLMSQQTTRMLSLVDDLLTLSRLEAEDTPATEELIDMVEMVERLGAEAAGLSGGRHRFGWRVDGPSLRGNRKELHSAFVNLVSNAVRYTPEGGEIGIAWSIDTAGSAVFAVTDSGVGIAAEHLPRLTERFYRVDRGRSRDSGGTGLGLAIVKHVLLRHQADLAITSVPGQGSRFAAVFPAWRLGHGSRSAAPAHAA